MNFLPKLIQSKAMYKPTVSALLCFINCNTAGYKRFLSAARYVMYIRRPLSKLAYRTKNKPVNHLR